MKNLCLLLLSLFIPMACATKETPAESNNTKESYIIKSIPDMRDRPAGESCTNEWGECVETDSGVTCFCLGDAYTEVYESDIEVIACGSNPNECVDPNDLNIGENPLLSNPESCQEHLYAECKAYPVGFSTFTGEYGVCARYGNLFYCLCNNGDIVPFSIIEGEASGAELLEALCAPVQPEESCENYKGRCNIYEGGFTCYCEHQPDWAEGILSRYEYPQLVWETLLANKTCNDLVYDSCSMYDELCVRTDTDNPFCYWDCSEAENTEYYALAQWIEETCAEKASTSQEFIPPEGERASLCYLFRTDSPAYDQWKSCVQTSCQDPTVTELYLECGALKELIP